MRPRHAVLLTPSASSRAIAAPFCTDHCSLTAVHYPLSPLDATLMGSPASVANKRLTVWLNPLDATLTKNRGWGLQLSSGAASKLAPSTSRVSPYPYSYPYPLSFHTLAALSYTTAPPQLISTQSVTQTFHRDGGCTPSRHPGYRHPKQPVEARTALTSLHRYLLTSLPLGAHRAPLATLFLPWHANASASTSWKASNGAKRSHAPFAFRPTPSRRSRRRASSASPGRVGTSVLCESRFMGTINTAGSKLVRAMVK